MVLIATVANYLGNLLISAILSVGTSPSFSRA